MSIKRGIIDYVDDILESIIDIRTFINDMTFDQFITDKKQSTPLFVAWRS